MDEPDIFECQGYRQFLQQWTSWKKISSRNFSLRQFAAKVGFLSHAHWPKILDGTRNLTADSLEQVVVAIGLRSVRARYFRLLVQHDQCDDPRERENLFESLSRIRRVRNRRRLGAAQSNYYDRWYYPVIRHLAPWASWNNDPAKLGAMLDPPISGGEARKALEELVGMGLLAEDQGSWKVLESMVSVNHLPYSVKVKGRHDILQMGIESLHRFAPEERSTRCFLLGLGEEGLVEVDDILKDAMRRCLEVSSREIRPSRIVQGVVQLFPMTRRLS